MSDPDELLENELRSFRPAEPSRQLATAIGDALAPTSSFAADVATARVNRLRASLWFSWSVTAVAACFAIAVLSRETTPATSTPVENTQPADDQRVVPVSSSNTLLAARDEGIVYLDSGQPARRYRLQYVDTFKLRAEGETASIDVSYPREEIRLVPVNAF